MNIKNNIALCSILCSAALFADPLSTYIGTKAKGMGGAFTAIANNNSAVYFNPAGLITFNETGALFLTVEGGSGAMIDQSKTQMKQYDTTSQYMVAASLMSPKIGIAVAMYSLYDLKIKDKIHQKLYKENVEVISLSLAYSPWDNFYGYGGKLSVGTTLGYAYSSSDSKGTTLSLGNGLYSFGLKFRALQFDFFQLDLATNYRMQTDLEGNVDGYGKFRGIGVPQELTYATALYYGSDYGLFTLSYDHKETEFSKVTGPQNTEFLLTLNDAKTDSIGLELATGSVQLRGGVYTSSDTVNNDNYGSGYTAGLGYTMKSLKLGKINIPLLNLEVSYDHRIFQLDNLEEKTNDYISLSLNIGAVFSKKK